MAEEQNYTIVIVPGSGWQGANWIVCLRDAVPPKAANEFRKGGYTQSLYSFEAREDAEKCRDELLRAFILQASQIDTPDSWGVGGDPVV